MIFTHTKSFIDTPPDKMVRRTPVSQGLQDEKRHGLPTLSILTWICLLLSCVGTGWFAVQYFLVAQPGTYAPSWHGAQWIQTADGSNNTQSVYFRATMDVNALPDDGFITIAANQDYYLYVNGYFVGTNDKEFKSVPRAHIYDVASALVPGANLLAVRVNNLDSQLPALRLSFGVAFGNSINYYGTNASWKATSQPALIYPSYGLLSTSWNKSTFDGSSWPAAGMAANTSFSPMLQVNPELIQEPKSPYWISAGPSKDGYFVTQAVLPSSFTGAWLRLVTTGTTSVFINGNQYFSATYQRPVKQALTNYLGVSKIPIHYRHDLVLAIYNISPYLHSGINTIAIHVSLQGSVGAQDGVISEDAALSLDMLVGGSGGSDSWLSFDNSWHIAHQAAAGWQANDSTAMQWPVSTPIARPGPVHVVYYSNLDATFSAPMIAYSMLLEILSLSAACVVGLWLLLSFCFARLFSRSLNTVMKTFSLAYLPAVACEALFVAISLEPLVPQPFPYTFFWGTLLLALVGAGYLLLGLQMSWGSFAKAARGSHTKTAARTYRNEPGLFQLSGTTTPVMVAALYRTSLWQRAVRVLKDHWIVLPLIGIAIPLIFYNLGYEPYWQDELTSYYVARGIMAHGLPLLPSGFLYPKGELYSYMLALFMTLFGDQNGAPRIISATECILTIPLIYYVGCYFFDKRIAWLATAMFTLSPLTIIWARQERMYQQAQLLTLLTFLLFYKAIQERGRVRLIYLAAFCFLLTYLSHEETFITIPAFAICILVASKDKQRWLPAVFYQKHWWFAAGMIGAILGVQLAIVHYSHPPVLGTDTSQESPVQLTLNNIPFYFYLLFYPSGNNAGVTGTLISGANTFIVLNSILAMLGCIWALRSKVRRLRYCALFFMLALGTLIFGFTMVADRYFYPLLPEYYLLGAYALFKMLAPLQAFARSCSRELCLEDEDAKERRWSYLSKPLKGIPVFVTTLLALCMLIIPMMPISSYNLFVSKVAHFTYYHHYVNFDPAGIYVQEHWQAGDIVISVIPDQIVAFYAGHTSYFVSIDHALFLFERDGHIVDTYTGNTALLNQADFQAILNLHHRIWIISDNSHYQSMTLRRFSIPKDFQVVYNGYESIVFFRGG